MTNLEQAIALTVEAVAIAKEKKETLKEITGRFNDTEFNSIVHLIVHCIANPLTKKQKGDLIRAMIDAGRTDNDAILVCGIANNRKVQKAGNDAETFAEVYAGLQAAGLKSKTALRKFTQEEKRISDYAYGKAEELTNGIAFINDDGAETVLNEDASEKLLTLIAKAIDAAIEASKKGDK
ncbi:hypothetical protein UFOVP1292_55 [uncultured Caudovirales phage]|uniref:Uncharacterized protein n=1 Tax=uncultured Caudovirales phage TaxID=2100421 RepID=A0A6J5P9E1_9CAUD|nr:hypothetical protein UFOVP859_40 [uncultured Caudovirales phage]CAB4168499.1 hypothetical protein UFOVP882_37 [uncultured Caudovirales phage]CAB4196451.1 hypothetical protein UFOVP1292_55 [uncultured Caudovirales phage]CAB4205230.1 hypothetical protein UFOVP1411_46 [uncultured Caudovirales phage]